jgi:hypothetical protein
MSRSIALEFNRHHSDYKQLERKGDVCIYNYFHEKTGRLQGYEVVKLYIDKHGVEYFPGTSLWGTNGFTYLPEQLDKAKDKFNEMYKASLVKKAKKSK